MKTASAIDKIKAGGFLMSEFDEDTGHLKFRCVPGGGVTPKQAQRIIQELSLQPAGDALFENVPSQTWKL